MQAAANIRQSILDLAVQVYGSGKALAQVLADNIKTDFELASELTPGRLFTYDIENGAANKRILRKLNGRFVMAYKTRATDSGVITDTTIITEDGFNIITEDGQTIIKE